MEDDKLIFYIPTDEHIADLREKGINVELEMARLVCDCLKSRKEGKVGIRKIGIAVSKEQMEELEKYGINGPEMCAVEFKEELHAILTGKKNKS